MSEWSKQLACGEDSVANKAHNPIVQVPDKFGGVRQISLDTNRFAIADETLFRARNLVAFRSHAIHSDALMWILTPAVILRGLMHSVALGLSLIGAIVTLLLLMVPVLLLVIRVADEQPGAVLYRLFLIASGIAIASL